MRKPIFLDRDGVLNVDVAPYVSKLEEFEIFPWTEEALVMLNWAGYDIFVVSNQQGVPLGITPLDELEKMTQAVQDLVQPHGFQIKKFYYCLARDSENHPWRKPACGMITAAGEEFGFDPTGSFLIGDKDTDMEAGKAGGCRPLLVLSGVTPRNEDLSQWIAPPEKVFENLLEAAHWVVSQ